MNRKTKPKRKRQPPQFPVATIAFYGPDDKTPTKVAVGIVEREGEILSFLPVLEGPAVAL